MTYLLVFIMGFAGTQYVTHYDEPGSVYALLISIFAALGFVLSLSREIEINERDENEY